MPVHHSFLLCQMCVSVCVCVVEYLVPLGLSRSGLQFPPTCSLIVAGLSEQRMRRVLLRLMAADRHHASCFQCVQRLQESRGG